MLNLVNNIKSDKFAPFIMDRYKKSFSLQASSFSEAEDSWI